MERIWTKHYPDGIPADVDIARYASIGDFFETVCQQFADKPMFCHRGFEITYQQLHQRASDFAAYLQSIGLQKGDRIALMMPNVLSYPVALYAALMLGLVVVNANPLYTAKELIQELNDAKPAAIVVFANFAHTLEKALAYLPPIKIIVTAFADIFPPLKRCWLNFAVKYLKRMVPSYRLPTAVNFVTALKKGRSQALAKPDVQLDDLAFLQYTGGTTGTPKGAMLTHGNMLANVEQCYAWFEQALQPGKEILIAALPIYHIFTLMVNCLLFLKFGSMSILITNPRDIPGMVKEIKPYAFTAITGVNLLFNALLNDESFKSCDFSQLRIAIGGGAAVQKHVATDWETITGKPLIEGYGLTETSPVVAVTPLTKAAFDGSIGLALPSTDVKIIDEQGQESGIDQPGELCVKGPQVMRGYWQRPEETKAVLSADGWLRTGDIATIDAQGFLRIVDRKKDMILVSGFNVYPNEIEDVISAMPAVLEVAVIGLPDGAHGEKVAAYVVKKDESLTKEQVISHCRHSLTGYKVPRYVEFREALPKSNVGKILRKSLREKQG